MKCSMRRYGAALHRRFRALLPQRDEIRRYGVALRRLYRASQLLTMLPLDYRRQSRIAQRLGRVFSPYRPFHRRLLSAFQSSLSVDSTRAREILRGWEANLGQSTADTFRHLQMDSEWVKTHVEVDDPEVLAEIASTGGLVLTYHTFHPNTLGIILGQSGIRGYGVSASVEEQPYAPYIGRYQYLMLNATQKMLGGGRYLYANDVRSLANGVQSAFMNGDAVVALCDNHFPGSQFPWMRIFGRSIRIRAGILKIARRTRARVYFALLYADLMGGYRLHLKSYGPFDDLQQGAQAYFHFLEDQLKNAPWAWQGWWWYLDLADAGGNP